MSDSLSTEQLAQFAALINNTNIIDLVANGQISQEQLTLFHAALGKIIAPAPAATAKTAHEVLAEYWQNFDLWKQAAPTGHSHFDNTLGGGFLPGRLYALLGQPGVGKTTLAIQWAVSIADTGRPVIYVTSEDSPHQLMCRTLARLANIDYGAVLGSANGAQKTVSRERIESVIAAYNERRSAQTLLIVEHAGMFSISALEAAISAHVAKFPGAGAPIVVIDYLQRLARSSAAMAQMDIRQAVTALTEQLREYAKRANVSMLVLASQNRDSYGGGNGKDRSMLASAKESGDIEYTADVLAALVVDDRAAPDSETRTLLLKIEKNRQGKTGQIKIDYNPSRQRLDEVDEHANGKR